LKIIYITLLTVVWISLSGCQKSSPVTDNAIAMNKQPIHMRPKLPCLSGTTPYIKDTTKLKKMLLASGKITVEMSVEQVNKIVKNYIKKKQDAFKRCKKEG